MKIENYGTAEQRAADGHNHTLFYLFIYLFIYSKRRVYRYNKVDRTEMIYKSIDIYLE